MDSTSYEYLNEFGLLYGCRFAYIGFVGRPYVLSGLVCVCEFLLSIFANSNTIVGILMSPRVGISLPIDNSKFCALLTDCAHPFESSLHLYVGEKEPNR